MQDTNKIYVDIDSLLDVRSSILKELCTDQDKLITFLNSEDYNFRQSDVFDIVDKEQYKQLEANRHVDLIPNSVITFIITSIKTKLDNLEKRNNFYGETKTPEVLLNVYPFVLTEKQAEAIQNILFIKLETNTLVNLVRMSPKEVSPTFIKTSNIVTAFIYDFTSWMNEHSVSIEKTKLPDTLLYFPSLSKDNVEEKDLKSITDLGFKDIFSYTEYFLSSYVNINFLPVVFYSNLITATLYVDKFNKDLKEESLNRETDQEKENGDSSTKIQVP